jgi:hypothetical protein
MLVVRTTERPAHPVGQFIRAQQSIELHDLALAMNPFGLDGVQPRALLRQKATDDPYCPYSPECVEGVFCELRVDGGLRSSPIDT